MFVVSFLVAGLYYTIASYPSGIVDTFKNLGLIGTASAVISYFAILGKELVIYWKESMKVIMSTFSLFDQMKQMPSNEVRGSWLAESEVGYTSDHDPKLLSDVVYEPSNGGPLYILYIEHSPLGKYAIDSWAKWEIEDGYVDARARGKLRAWVRNQHEQKVRWPLISMSVVENVMAQA